MEYKPTVVFDFDGVIHSYTSGWKGAEEIPDAPVPGISEAIERIRMAGYRVVVVSTRCGKPTGMGAVRRYLQENGIVVDDVMMEKPPAVCYIDDRAIQFDGNAEALFDKVANFRTWQQMEKAPEAVTIHIPQNEKVVEELRESMKNARISVCYESKYPADSLRLCEAMYYASGKIVRVKGRFHCWGSNYEEFDSGPGVFTTAIIELDDGRIVSCPAETVQFLDRGGSGG